LRARLQGSLTPLATSVVAVGASVSCAALLHSASTRADAAWVLPIVVAWGIAPIVATRAAPEPSIGWLILVALAVRLPLVGTPPLLSDDLFRYLFEGAALNAGHNPFLESPAQLVGIDDALRVQVNHPEVTTVYPPLALLWFRFVALLGGPTGVQLCTALVDVAVPVALVIATRKSWTGWVYALHPLPALEAASGAHIDVPAVALAIIGVAAWRRGHLGAGFVAVAGGALVKLLPAVIGPVLLRRLGWRSGSAWVAVAAGVAVLLAWPVLDAGPHLLTGIGNYAGSWSFNGLLHPWLAPMLGDGARPVLVAAGLGVALWALRHPDPGRAWATVGAGFVLLSPTVHPWYVLWAMVPALACGRAGWAIAAIPLMMSYSVLWTLDPVTGAWAEAPWLWWVTWPAAIAALAYDEGRSEWSATAP